MQTRSRLGQKTSFVTRLLVRGLSLGFMILSASQTAYPLPAFARKYGLRCSACREAWPMLNSFGRKFRDNGYQLMNDRDSPIWLDPSYWPVTFRITPFWHRESTDKVSVDSQTGNAASAPVLRKVNS